MTNTYTLELNFVLTDEQQKHVIEAARRVYAAGPPNTRYDGDTPHKLTSEEFIDGPGSALLHLLDQNTVLEELDIFPNEVSHTDPDYDPAEHEVIAEDLEQDFKASATRQTTMKIWMIWEMGFASAGGRMATFRL